MMSDEKMLEVVAACFAPVDKDKWCRMTRGAPWQDFMDAARHAMQVGNVLGEDVLYIEEMRKRIPLDEVLAAGEIDALFCPPTYEEKQVFAARHFVGGLPESVPPVESLYRPWTDDAKRSSFARNSGGMYWGDSALYMRDLIERMNIEVTEELSAYPDHLTLILKVAAALLKDGMAKEAREFLSERLTWLTDYRMDLLKLKDEARFYIGLVDLLVGLQLNVNPANDADGAYPANDADATKAADDANPENGAHDVDATKAANPANTDQ